MNQRTRTDWLLLAGFCLFLFIYGLGRFGLIGADEPRYAQVAREMLERHEWITPTLGGRPWLEKPALYYWQAILVYRMLGVSDWAARLPSAIDASLMVLGVYFFLRRLRPGLHLDGALMTASAAGVIGFARAAAMDMPLAATFTLALLAWYAWWETSQRAYLAGFYALLALATLAKGPVAPVLAGMIVGLFALAAGNSRIIITTLWIPGMLLFFLVALPWYVAVELRHPEFFRFFILQHNLARFATDRYHHGQPIWFFLPVTALGLLPWLVFVMGSGVETARGWWSERARLFDSGDALSFFLLLWLIVPVVFFSLSQSKLPGYILPALPAGPMLVAEHLRRHSDDEYRPAGLLIALHSIAASAPVVPALLVPYLFLPHGFAWSRATGVACGIALFLAAGIVVTLRGKLGLRMLRFVTLIPVVIAVAAVMRIAAPSIDRVLSARPLAEQLAQMESRSLPVAVFGVGRETEYGLAFYRNEIISRYELNQIPFEEHLLVAPAGAHDAIVRMLEGRRVTSVGRFEPQALDYYWVAKSRD